MSDSTPPSDSPRVHSWVSPHTLTATSSPALTWNEIIPPNRFIWRRATSWPGCDLQPGVVDGAHGRVRREELDDPLGVVAVLLHPQRERLEAAQHQPGVERPGHRAHRVLVEGDPIDRVLEAGHGDVAADDDGTADDVAVAAAVLRRRVRHDVGAQRQRLLEVGARRRCCRRRAGRRRRGRPRPARRCRRSRAAGWWASRPRPSSCARGGSPRGRRRGRPSARWCARRPTARAPC